MEKVYVVYWSQTGNTEAMANMRKSGVEAAGANIVGGEGIIANNEPDAEAEKALKAAGEALAKL